MAEPRDGNEEFTGETKFFAPRPRVFGAPATPCADHRGIRAGTASVRRGHVLAPRAYTAGRDDEDIGMSFRKLWTAFALVVVCSFAVLGWMGVRIYQEAPPVPERVVTTDGAELIGPDEIHDGQNVWQSIGGMEVGSVWGHGSYVAPDWTADWLHREAVFILDRWAESEYGTKFEKLDNEKQSQLSGRLSTLMRVNTYDPA